MSIEDFIDQKIEELEKDTLEKIIDRLFFVEMEYLESLEPKLVIVTPIYYDMTTNQIVYKN